jgi:hypothetical protein
MLLAFRIGHNSNMIRHNKGHTGSNKAVLDDKWVQIGAGLGKYVISDKIITVFFAISFNFFH